MKLLIASDIHGSAFWAERLMAAIEAEAPDRIALLGDLLYHGPRNALPRGYDPMRTASQLNGLAATGQLIAVRGNCDAEVDQMVLDFPCMADSAQIIGEGGRTIFLTHGHVFGMGFPGSVDILPALPEGTAVAFGHTHVKVNGEAPGRPGIWAFNPGSVSLPKDGTHSCGIYESGLPRERAFRHVVLEER